MSVAVGGSVCQCVLCSFFSESVCLLYVRLCLCLFLIMSVFPRPCVRSHVQCTGCHNWKSIADEAWAAHQIENNRRKNIALICGTCTSARQARGQGRIDAALKKCEACKTEKGRCHFRIGLWDEKKRTPSCLLICLECAEREKDLLGKMKAREAWKCTKKCREDWPHMKSCQVYLRWHGYPLVTREELKWLHFRGKNKKFH